jgi:hypothetical protein
MSSMQNFDTNSVIDFEGAYYTEVNGYQIPQNIRHRFRSLITSELLSDTDKVERDKNELAYVNIKQKHPIYHRSQTTLSPISDPDYTKLSNDLRTVVCRGNPVQRVSHTKTVHNEDIFKDYFQDDKQPNLYRRKKDWLGRWTEANIVRDRLYKNILEAKKKATQ